MIAQQLRAWHRAERRPPELSFESFLVNAIHQGFHVSISFGEFLRIKLPIAHVVLPAVVECHPLKSQALHRRERVIHLLRLDRSAISPRTPDSTESLIGSRGHLEPLPCHEPSVVS